MSTASELEYVQLGDFLFSSALALLYYDHLLTLDAEFQLIWKRSRSTSRYLFFVNRYFAFFGNIPAAYSLFSTSLTLSRFVYIFMGSSSLNSLLQIENLQLSFISPLPPNLHYDHASYSILTLRVYALYGCRKLFLACFLGVLALGTLISIILTIIIHSSASQITITSEGCRNVTQNLHSGASKLSLNQFDYIRPDFNIPQAMAIGWEGILLLDTILFVLTLWKAYHNRLAMGTSRVGVSLFSVVVRDGTIYFFIIASLNLANIVSFYVPGNLPGNFSALVGCLSVTLMSRMMLDLHEAADTGIYTNRGNESTYVLSQDVWFDRGHR
ncbi:hypothetical protein DFH05DRAFT_1524106 [Lentinula detonsa]|uniref:DUF6533 domain-containing protein n=1 Tax=Lentinula detonsa TaxID=2804962 RepID=A0A9W8P2S5_9AGAR|nr:hypothetical protein DFH05DRAFT_1524106 [Lentinula detonsa]